MFSLCSGLYGSDTYIEFGRVGTNGKIRARLFFSLKFERGNFFSIYLFLLQSLSDQDAHCRAAAAGKQRGRGCPAGRRGRVSAAASSKPVAAGSGSFAGRGGCCCRRCHCCGEPGRRREAGRWRQQTRLVYSRFHLGQFATCKWRWRACECSTPFVWHTHTHRWQLRMSIFPLSHAETCRYESRTAPLSCLASTNSWFVTRKHWN